MDLAQRVADSLGIERRQAEVALSTVFTSIRMSVDPAVFARVTAAVPEAETWMRGIQLAGGRTGEIVALAGPAALARQLAAAGLTDQHITKLGTALSAALAELLGEEVFQQVAARVPLLKR
jgi:hypothetical protein